MTKWKHTQATVAPGESWFDVLRKMGAEGWEPWHIEKTENGWRTLYFKRPLEPT